MRLLPVIYLGLSECIEEDGPQREKFPWMEGINWMDLSDNGLLTDPINGSSSS